MNYVVRRGTGPVWQDVEPGRSGWSWTGIRVVDLAPGEGHEVVLGDREAVVVPLIGPVTVSTDGATFDLAGRRSPFDAATDAAYVPRGAALRLEGTGRIAVATAVAGARFEPAWETTVGSTIDQLVSPAVPLAARSTSLGTSNEPSARGA